MTPFEKIDEIQKIREQLRQEFPAIVLQQVDRVSHELEILQDRVTQLIKLMGSEDVKG